MKRHCFFRRDGYAGFFRKLPEKSSAPVFVFEVASGKSEVSLLRGDASFNGEESELLSACRRVSGKHGYDSDNNRYRIEVYDRRCVFPFRVIMREARMHHERVAQPYPFAKRAGGLIRRVRD